jgi:hypothetical protein
LFWHLDLIVHVTVGVIGANQGYERFWGLLRTLKELMSYGCTAYEIDQSVIQPHEFGPVSIAWLYNPLQKFE